MKIEWQHEKSVGFSWESYDLWVDGPSANSWVIRYKSNGDWSNWTVRIKPVLMYSPKESYKSLEEAKAVLLALFALSGD